VIDTTNQDVATVLVDELRAAGFSPSLGLRQPSMKSQMKVADKSGARFALLGPPGDVAGEVTIRTAKRRLRADATSCRPKRVVFVVAELLTKSWNVEESGIHEHA